MRKAVKYAIAIPVLSLAALAATLYLLANKVPGDYQPAQLTPEDRQHVFLDKFAPRMGRFSNGAQGLDPFTWSVSAHDLNVYLASLDEIHSFRDESKAGEVDRAMAKAGIAEPAVALDDGVLTVMARATRYNKVISADIGFDFPAAGKVQIRLKSVRVGWLPVPKSYVRKALAKLRKQLESKVADRQADIDATPSQPEKAPEQELLARMFALLGSAMDGEPADTEFLWPYNKKWVRIDGVEIVDGTLTLHVTPTRRLAP